MGRWSIFIDIDGFGVLWEKEDHVLRALGALMLAIFRLGRLCYPSEPDRIFAHQLGDGFIVVSDFHEDSLERCTTLAIAMMRHVAAATGRYTRAAISEGELSDIEHCYPDEVTVQRERDHSLELGSGVMTINPIMGTALINAVSIDKIGPRGPLLMMDLSKTHRLGSSIPYKEIPKLGLAAIDWVHMQSNLLRSMQQKADLEAPTPKQLEVWLNSYCTDQPVPQKWRSSVYELLEVPIETGTSF